MFVDVDLTEPMNAMFFMTGVFAWLGLVVSGLWFAIAGAIRVIQLRIESRRTVELLFGDEPLVSDEFVLTDSNGSGVELRLPRYARAGDLD